MGKTKDFESKEYILDRIKAFYSKIKIDESGCWIWVGCTNEKYGMIKFKKTNLGAHRFSYKYIKKIEPGDLNVCHTCDNPLCVNPDHLFLGTNHDNMKDASIKRRLAYGEKHYRNRLKEKEIKEIQRLSKLGLSQTQIAKVFDIEQTNISHIILGKNWKNLERLEYKSDNLIKCMITFFGEMETYKLLLFYDQMEENLKIYE